MEKNGSAKMTQISIEDDSLLTAITEIQRLWRGFLGRKEFDRLLLIRERAKRKPQNRKNGANQPKSISHDADRHFKDVIYNDDGDEVVLFKAVKKSTPISSNCNVSESKDNGSVKPKVEVPNNAIRVPKNTAFRSPIKSNGSSNFGEDFLVSGGVNSNHRKSLALSRIQEEMMLSLRDSLENTRNSLADSLEMSRKGPNLAIPTPVVADDTILDHSDDFSDSLNGENEVEEDENESSVGDELRAHDLYQFMLTVEEKYNSTPKPSKKSSALTVDTKRDDVLKEEVHKSSSENGHEATAHRNPLERKNTVTAPLAEDTPLSTVRSQQPMSSRTSPPKSVAKKSTPTVRDLLLISPRLSNEVVHGGNSTLPSSQSIKPEQQEQLEKAKQQYEQSVSRNFKPIKQQQALMQNAMRTRAAVAIQKTVRGLLSRRKVAILQQQRRERKLQEKFQCTNCGRSWRGMTFCKICSKVSTGFTNQAVVSGGPLCAEKKSPRSSSANNRGHERSNSGIPVLKPASGKISSSVPSQDEKLISQRGQVSHDQHQPISQQQPSPHHLDQVRQQYQKAVQPQHNDLHQQKSTQNKDYPYEAPLPRQQVQPSQRNQQLHMPNEVEPQYPPRSRESNANQRQRKLIQPVQDNVRQQNTGIATDYPISPKVHNGFDNEKQGQRHKGKTLEQTRISEEEERLLLAELEVLNRIQAKKQKQQQLQQPPQQQPLPVAKERPVVIEVPHSNKANDLRKEKKSPANKLSTPKGQPAARDPQRLSKAKSMSDDAAADDGSVKKHSKEKDPVREKEKLAFKWGARDVKPKSKSAGEREGAKHFKPKHSDLRPPQPQQSNAPHNALLAGQPPLQPMLNNLMAPQQSPMSLLQPEISLAGRGGVGGGGGGGGYLKGFQSKNSVKKKGHGPRDRDYDDESYSGVASAYSKASQVDSYSDNGMSRNNEASSLPALLSSRHNQQMLRSNDDDRPGDLDKYDSPAIHPLAGQNRRVDQRFGGGNSRNSTMSAPPRLREDAPPPLLGGKVGYSPAAPHLPAISSQQQQPKKKK